MRRAWPLMLLLAACQADELEPAAIDLDVLPTRITFGSCSDPRSPMPLLDVARDLAPDLHVWLGDNVYADTVDPDEMRTRYQELGDAPAFQALAEVAAFVATWDDHDYGQNDAGRAYPMREASEQIFLDFWNEPADSPRRGRPGIHHAWRFGNDAPVLQLIVLDTRFHRDGLTFNDGSGVNDYIPNQDTATTLLGEEQWVWLEEQLLQEADLRVVASSIQLGHSYNGYESWTLFPHERDRFAQLVADTAAEGVMVISGDVHWAEVSRFPNPSGYDIPDITSSGINQDWPFVSDNAQRVAGPFAEHNVGLLTIDWEARRLVATIHDGSGAARISWPIAFEDLR